MKNMYKLLICMLFLFPSQLEAKEPGLKLPGQSVTASSYQVTVEVQPEGGGSISGEGYYSAGDNVVISGTVNPGYWLNYMYDPDGNINGNLFYYHDYYNNSFDYSFNMLAEDVNLVADFTEAPVMRINYQNPMYIEVYGGMVSDGYFVDFWDLENTGLADLHYEISYEMDDDAPIFIDIYPSSGIIAPGENEYTLIDIQSDPFLKGQYSGNIIITSNDPINYHVQIPVYLDIICHNPQDGGIIDGWQTIPYNSAPATFTSHRDASDYAGLLEYKWQYSTTGPSEGFADIPAYSDAPEYKHGKLTQDTWFRRLAMVWCEGNWDDAAISNEVEVTVRPAFAGGDGTLSNPFQITNAEQLNNIRHFLGDGNSGTYYKVLNDIDLADYLTHGGAGHDIWGESGWLPIGTSTHRFEGILQGNGTKITGLKIDRPGLSDVGLFGFLGVDAVIKDIGVETGTEAPVSGNEAVGIIAGQNLGTIHSCFSTGNVWGYGQTGGLAGHNNNGVIINCYTHARVKRHDGSISDNLGAFVGLNNQGKINNCYTTGMVIYAGADDPTHKGFAGSVSTGGNYEMTGNFWNIETSLQTTSAGSTDGESELPHGLTIDQMRQQEVFADAGWDFYPVGPGATWAMSSAVNEGYPFLAWQADIWNGSGAWENLEYWSKGGLPAETSDVLVYGGLLTISQEVTVKRMTVKPGASVTLGSGNTLSVEKLIMESHGEEVEGARDNISVASFVNMGTVVADLIEYERYMPAGAFEYISSPVADQTASVFAPLATSPEGGNGLFEFNTTGNAWSAPIIGTGIGLTAMKGFAFIAKENSTVTFSGSSLHGGDQSITLTKTEDTGFNLVGNPYSSAIDWDNSDGWTRYEGDPEPAVSPVVWINYADASGEGNFATYNYLTPEAHVNWEGNVGDDAGVIPPTQAFWVLAEDDGAELTVKPGAQVHSENVVHKKSAAATLNPMLRLQAEKGGYTDEMVVLFHESATEGYDRYDTRKKMGSGSFPQLYMSVSGTDLAVNALPVEILTEGLVIPLTLRSPAQGNYTISLTELRAFDVFTEILLADRQKDITVSLRASPVYSFDLASSGDVTGRFELIIGDNTVTDVEELTAAEADIYSHGGLVYISGAGIGDRWEILNMTGVRLLEGQTDVDGTKVIGTNLPVGIYMVVLHTAEGRVVKRVYIE